MKKRREKNAEDKKRKLKRHEMDWHDLKEDFFILFLHFCKCLWWQFRFLEKEEEEETVESRARLPGSGLGLEGRGEGGGKSGRKGRRFCGGWMGRRRESKEVFVRDLLESISSKN